MSHDHQLLSPRSLLGQAAVAVRKGNHDRAVAILTDVLAHEEARRSDILVALLMRAQSYISLRKIHESDMDFQAVLTVDPTNAVAQDFTNPTANQHGRAVPSFIAGSSHNTLIVHPRNRSKSPGSDYSLPEVTSTFSAFRGRQARDLALTRLLLPYELWNLVALFLSHSSVRTWLSVSRLHRAVAIPILFSEIELQFRRLSVGQPGPPTPNGGSTLHDRQRSKAAEEVLQRIASDPGFGSSVKSIRILGWIRATPEQEDTLLAALKNLPAVRSLYWSHTDFSSRVIDALVRLLPGLRDVSFGSTLTAPFGISGMQNLKSVTTWNLGTSPELKDEVARLLAANYRSLESYNLAVTVSPSPSTTSVAIPLAARLRHIGLSDACLQRDALERIFTSAPTLQSLIIQGKPARSFAPAVVFRSHCDALPELRSFCLRINDRLASDLGLFSAIAMFLKDRNNLERLALQDSMGSSARMLGPLKSVLPSLKNLKALRIRLGGGLVYNTFLELVPVLPRSLEAIYIGGNGSGMDIDLVHFAGLFSTLPNLTTLLIENQRISPTHVAVPASPTYTTTVMAEARLIAVDLVHLTMVGVRGIEFDVRRLPAAEGDDQIQVELIVSEPVTMNDGDATASADWVRRWPLDEFAYVLE